MMMWTHYHCVVRPESQHLISKIQMGDFWVPEKGENAAGMRRHSGTCIVYAFCSMVSRSWIYQFAAVTFVLCNYYFNIFVILCFHLNKIKGSLICFTVQRCAFYFLSFLVYLIFYKRSPYSP